MGEILEVNSKKNCYFILNLNI